jgi:type II secretory pathway pseudopilin PulG
MTRRRPRPQHQDSGASLILAIAFVVMIGAIAAGLASLATSSMNNRTTLEQVRDRQYAADGAIEEAISTVRSFLAGSDRDDCRSKGSFPPDTLNSLAIQVDWRNACGVVRASDGTVVAQRNVILSACVEPTADVECADANVIIRAQVNFQQASTGVTKTYIQSWSVNR